MTSWGNCDFSSLEKLEKKLAKISDTNKNDEFYRECAKELAARLMRKVVQRTPTGTSMFAYEDVVDNNGNNVIYKRGKSKGKTKKKRVNTHIGGTLKKNWHIGDIVKVGSSYQVQISNPIEYASYVEYGHRQTPGRFIPAIGKRLKKNWVEGRFMLMISEQELKASAPKILEKKLEDYLRRCFND